MHWIDLRGIIIVKLKQNNQIRLNRNTTLTICDCCYNRKVSKRFYNYVALKTYARACV